MDRAEPRTVLILCTGNSCRSQMAESLWNHLGDGQWSAQSAGSRPAGYVHEMAIQVLDELGLPTDRLVSKSSDPFRDIRFDLVVTVCDNAQKACPHWPSARKILHWPFMDPADATGSDAEKRAVFREVRDQIEQKIRSNLPKFSDQDCADKQTTAGNGMEIVFDDATRDEAKRLIALALVEDLGSADSGQQLDITTQSVVPANVRGVASFVSRQSGVVCGVAVSQLVIEAVNRDLDLEVVRQDGDAVVAGDVIAVLRGNAQDILVAERTCLNFMGRLSGISTMTQEFVEQVAGTEARVLDTRKTTPGWRRLEKYAVSCGGGTRHRMGLYDAVLIKDNHLAMMDSLTDEPMDEIPVAIASARKWIGENAHCLTHGENTILQIEVDRLDQFEKAVACSPDIILLDNMSNEQLCAAVETRARLNKDVLLEASGGVNLQTIAKIAKTGVDRISVGALTHSSVNLDIGLDWEIG